MGIAARMALPEPPRQPSTGSPALLRRSGRLVAADLLSAPCLPQVLQEALLDVPPGLVVDVLAGQPTLQVLLGRRLAGFPDLLRRLGRGLRVGAGLVEPQPVRLPAGVEGAVGSQGVAVGDLAGLGVLLGAAPLPPEQALADVPALGPAPPAVLVVDPVLLRGLRAGVALAAAVAQAHAEAGPELGRVGVDRQVAGLTDDDGEALGAEAPDALDPFPGGQRPRDLLHLLLGFEAQVVPGLARPAGR